MNEDRLYVCIATGQNLANLIPALQLGVREARILATPPKAESARVLGRAFKLHRIRAEIVPFCDGPPEALDEAAREFAVSLDGRRTLFNATGGTKLMVFALTENLRVLEAGAQSAALEIVYADTAHDALVWLTPRRRSPEPMRDVLALDDIVAAQGLALGKVCSRQQEWVARVEARGELTLELGDRADKLAGLFGTLNRLAHASLDASGEALVAPTQRLDYPPGGRHNPQVLRQAQRFELLDWDGDTKIHFRDAECARYFAGGWLEEYALFKVRGCKARDWGVGVNVESVGDKVRNELDAVVVNRNRLLVIECKTRRFGRDDERDADAIYKLDHLAQKTGGLMHDSLLLSARPVGEAARRRANEACITVLDGAAVRTLPGFLRSWVSGDNSISTPEAKTSGKPIAKIMNRKEEKEAGSAEPQT